MSLQSFFPWIAQTIFFVAILNQIKLNTKLKSTKGLSDLLLIGYLNGYIFYLFYVFCRNLTFAHKVLIPLSFVAVFTIVVQRFYYSKKFERKLFFIYLINLLAALLFVPIAKENALFVGNFSGWIMTAIWAIYQLPQILKVFTEKSVKGFSFGLVFLLGFGNLLELFVALSLKLPIQTSLNNCIGVMTFVIFTFFFLRFRDRSQNQKIVVLGQK